MGVLKCRVDGTWVEVGGAAAGGGDVLWTGPSAPTDPTIELWADTDEATPTLGVGIPAGGTTGQVLTKSSATDYAVTWGTNTPVLANNSYLQGYRSDGTTAQNLIGIDTVNGMFIGQAAPANVNIANNAVGQIYIGYQATQDILIGSNALGNIHIGNSLAAGKAVFVPRLTVQGPITVGDQQWIMSSTGQELVYPYSPGNKMSFCRNCDAQFNEFSGNSTFARQVYMYMDLQVAGSIGKTNVGWYTFPDFVFEHAYRGSIQLFANAHGAQDYAGLLPLAEVERQTRETLRLPGPRQEKYDLFARGDEVLAYVEQIFLHLFALNRRIEALEAAR